VLDGKTITLRSKFSESQASLILDQIAAGSRKMLRRTPEEIETARVRREEWWKLRQNGKLSPSEALAKQNAAKNDGKPAGDAKTPVDAKAPGDAPKPEPAPEKPAEAPLPSVKDEPAPSP
jgi:hypothetical protein